MKSVAIAIGALLLVATRSQSQSKDTLEVSFLRGFKYDKIILLQNGNEVLNQMLYSSSVSNYTNVSKSIFVQDSLIELTAVLFEMNYEGDVSYNPLWFDWRQLSDDVFHKPKSYTYVIDLTKGKFVTFELVRGNGSVLLDECLDRYSDLELSMVQRHNPPVLD